MYQQFYGLNASPFELTANPKCLFLSAGHREALSNLEYGLSTAKAITLLIGEAGTGKTTLVKAAMDSDRCKHVKCLFIDNPVLTSAEFFQTIGRQLGFWAQIARSKATLLAELEYALLQRRRRGESMALVVDEAHSLSHELLEEIRLLTNIETDSEKLMPLVLAGQPELGSRLNESSLRQLKQRVALRCVVEPLTVIETASYIASRIKFAGGEAGQLFSREAVIMVHERSRGIPRTINVICDNALLNGMVLGRRPVGQDVVLDVCKDFDLWGASAAPARPTAEEVREPIVSSDASTARDLPVQEDASSIKFEHKAGFRLLRRALRG